MRLTHPRAPTQDKAALRLWMKERVASLTPSDRATRSQAIGRRLQAEPAFIRSRGVLCCLSFDTEVDTWSLVGALLAEGVRQVYVPRCARGDRRLTLHRYPCELETLSFGLRQPTASVPPLPEENIDRTIDCALILGVAYDPASRLRLGHGAGYFDRFLGRHRLVSLALAFEEQLVRELPADTWDVPMDALVTETAVYAAT